jgi:ribosomal protein S18 acetylase RimI-like enzyme
VPVAEPIVSEPGPDDVRLRRHLDGDLSAAELPAGLVIRGLRPGDPHTLHELLAEVLGDVVDPSFEKWWQVRSADPEFDAELCFLAFEPAGYLVGAACCWTSGFVKELAVHPAMRRRGIGAALLGQVFAAFRARGLSHVDLKTNLTDNADAVRLYRRLGMVEVGWEG